MGCPGKYPDRELLKVTLSQLRSLPTAQRSGSRDCTVRMWDAMSGAPIGLSLQGHPFVLLHILPMAPVLPQTIDDTVRT